MRRFRCRPARLRHRCYAEHMLASRSACVALVAAGLPSASLVLLGACTSFTAGSTDVDAAANADSATVGSEAGIDGDTSDARPGNDAATPFCANAPTSSLVCSDFDDPDQALERGWTLHGTQGVAIERTEIARSAPYAMRVAGGLALNASASLGRSVAIESDKDLSVRLAVRVDTIDEIMVRVFVAGFGQSSDSARGAAVGAVMDTQGNLAFELVLPTGTALPAPVFNQTLHQFHEIELRCILGLAGDTFTLVVDGVMTQTGTMQRPANDSTLNIGAGTYDPVTIDLTIDNVLVTSTPKL